VISDEKMVVKTDLPHKVASEIKSLFLSIAHLERKGFFVTLPSALSWVGAFDDVNTDAQRYKLIKNITDDYINDEEYNFYERPRILLSKIPIIPKEIYLCYQILDLSI
jgi:hypothetical protein